MKKILMKTLMVFGIAALGMVAGTFMAPIHAQFGATNGVADIQGISGTTEGMASKGLLSVVKTFINWILGLLSLIALGMSLYGGFKMVTAAGDDGKYKEGFKILKQAAIGLVVVGLSWIIVSTIFSVIGGVTSGDTTKIN